MTSSVLACEFLKVVYAIAFMAWEGNVWVHFKSWSLRDAAIASICPAAIYALQNTLLQLSYRHLDSLTFSLLNQTKLMFPALFMFSILGMYASSVIYHQVSELPASYTSKFQWHLIQSYRSRNDAIQSACWKAFLQLSQALDNGMGCWSSIGEPKKHIAPRENSQMHDISQNWEIICGEESSKRPPAGSVVSIAYDVHLVGEGMDEQIETNEDFDFEIGSGAVIGMLDACVSSLFVGQTAQFSMQPFPNELLYASCQEIINKIRNLNPVLEDFRLDFTVTLKSFLEAPEERMESAFFSPPLSRQRIDFAANLIRESQATSLVDLGCGSGSFLDAIFECQTNLAHIAGVDISPKSLVRAAKSLQAKISKNHQNTHLEDVLLYEGSIAELDSRLYDYDIATCIEVVEHMDPDALSKVGESILGTMSPKVLVLSTPNIEYNKILQGISNKFNQKVEDPEQKDPNESANSLAIKLRNDDHRFEWTRAEFCAWASGIAAQFGYSVDFTGVGKSSDQDPGFASQIAIFRRLQSKVNSESKTPPQLPAYKEVWKWSGIS